MSEDEATPQEEATPPEKEAPHPHSRQIYPPNGPWFWCVPSPPGSNPNPTSGVPWQDADGNGYWCVPREKEFGRRYDSKGRTDPDLVD